MILNNLNHILIDLMDECKNAIFCISSGSHKSHFYESFMKNKHKFKNLVVGTNNFTTTPSFLDSIVNLTNTTLIFSNSNYIKKDIIFNVNLYMFFMNDDSWILINSSTGLVSTHKASNFLHMSSLLDSVDLEDEDSTQIMDTFLKSLKEYMASGVEINEDSCKEYRNLFTNHHTYVNTYKLEDLTSQIGNHNARINNR